MRRVLFANMMVDLYKFNKATSAPASPCGAVQGTAGYFFYLIISHLQVGSTVIIKMSVKQLNFRHKFQGSSIYYSTGEPAQEAGLVLLFEHLCKRGIRGQHYFLSV